MSLGSLLGYLQLQSPTGGCTEILNNCRSLTYGKQAARKGLNIKGDGCETCCCPNTHTEDFETEGVEKAPWFDPTVAASAEFLGLYGGLSIGSFEGGQRLTFTGLLMSSCDDGRAYGDQWIRNMLEPFCGSCEGQEATVFTHCGKDLLEEAEEYQPDNPRPDPTINAGCCPEEQPPVLGQPNEILPYPETGLRRLLRVRYVNDSYQPIESDWPSCYGCQITFSFDIIDQHSFSEPINVCELGTEETGPIFDDCLCRPLKVVSPPLEDCGRCGKACECVPEPFEQTGEDSAAPAAVEDWVRECQYSKPICGSRTTCITPALPFTEAVPVITIEAGLEPVDLGVTFWEAHPGLPDPATCVGEDAYCNRDPLVPAGNVHVPAGATMVLDGQTGGLNLICDGNLTAAGDLVQGCDGYGFKIPTIRCNKRVWVAFDFDCYNPPGDDLKISVDVVGRERT